MPAKRMRTLCRQHRRDGPDFADCRLDRSGQSYRDGSQSQSGRGWLVHNGVVVNHASLVRQYRLASSTECDSEVLGLLVARIPGALGRRAARTAASPLTE
jgi:asparagine synthetase B (glutamine-hydrolysing)